ncbi:hypothetical protein F4802DRAFT_565705 [Xylaria palmicola]|nr:hypothetical protein F4802DRAFT_565705 [Xylaria palmicola]
MSSSATCQDDGAVQKHRACDECRTRKLACTKEPDGCSRCRRENIPCHYSPQKPMGRPRKRPRDGSVEGPTAATPPAKVVMTEQLPDTGEPGMNLIDLLLGADFDFMPSAEEQMTAIPTTTPAPVATTATTTLDTPSSMFSGPWDYPNYGDVNFDAQPAEHAQSFSHTSIDPALFISSTGSDPPSTDQVPALSPPGSNTTSSPQSSNTSPAAPKSSESSCDCTASLCSALDWMQKLPSEVEPAIRQARLAAKIAYEVVNCTNCSFKLEPPTQHPVGSPIMMRGFQNMMLLGTLIPSIVHAYAQMLTIVDEEANRAVAERRQVVFKLNSLGGMWGGFGPGDDESCGTSRNFNHREMEPVMWRLAVRALLKIDIYGISGRHGSDVSAADPFHLGLKDIVLLMENKANARHAFMDAMVDAGVWPQTACMFFSLNNPGEPRTCQRIISLAKSSIDQLCIP